MLGFVKCRIRVRGEFFWSSFYSFISLRLFLNTFSSFSLPSSTANPSFFHSNLSFSFSLLTPNLFPSSPKPSPLQLNPLLLLLKDDLNPIATLRLASNTTPSPSSSRPIYSLMFRPPSNPSRRAVLNETRLDLLSCGGEGGGGVREGGGGGSEARWVVGVSERRVWLGGRRGEGEENCP